MIASRFSPLYSILDVQPAMQTTPVHRVSVGQDEEFRSLVNELHFAMTWCGVQSFFWAEPGKHFYRQVDSNPTLYIFALGLREINIDSAEGRMSLALPCGGLSSLPSFQFQCSSGCMANQLANLAKDKELFFY